VSAAAAILRASSPTLDASSLRAVLESGTMDLGKPGRDTTYGYGLLQTASLCQPDPEPAVRSASGLKATP
jgi:hypothetical protein